MTTFTLPPAAEAVAEAEGLSAQVARDGFRRIAGNHARAGATLRQSTLASDAREADWQDQQAAALRQAASDAEPNRDELILTTGGPPQRRADRPETRTIDRRDANRRAADASLEWGTRSGLLPDHGAEVVYRLMDSGDAPSRTLAARWAATAGSEAYTRAFAAIAADPQRGHLRWDAEELAAFRAVEDLRAEQRDMWTAVPSAGGYMVPVYLDPTVLLTNDCVRSPIRSVARVEQITVGDRWTGLTSAGTTSEWKGELAEANETTPVVGNPQVPVFTQSTYCEYSIEVGMDAVNFLEQLSTIMLDASNTHLETAYATGSGIAQPQGLITGLVAAGGSVVVAPTTPEVFAKADVYKVQNALAPRWQSSASWLANLSILNSARQMETTNGAIAFPELEQGRLLRRPIAEWSLMDGAINPAAVENNYVLAYGSWRDAFLIADRIGATMEFVPVVLGANRRPIGARGAWLYLRSGPGVIVPDAGRILSIPTS